MVDVADEDRSPAPTTRPAWRRVVGGVLRVLFWLVVVVIAVLLSATIHLLTPSARRDLAGVISREASAGLPGEIVIPDFESLTPFGGVTSDVVVLDPQGREVIRGDHVTVELDPFALLHGEIRLTRLRVEGGAIHLYTMEDGSPSLVHAFDEPGDGDGDDEGGGPRVALERIEARGLEVEGEVVDFQDLRVTGLDADLRIIVDPDDPFELRVWDASGDVVGPFPYPVRLERTYTHLDDRRAHVWLRATRTRDDGEDEEVVAHLNVTGLDTPDAHFDLRTRVDPVSLDTLAGADLDYVPVRGPIRGRVALEGPADGLAIRGSLETEAGHVNLDGELGPGPIRVRATTEGLDLDRLLEGAPGARLRGEAEIVLTEPEPRVSVDLGPTDLGDVTLPPLRANGRLADDRVHIDDATLALRGGDATLSGEIGFDGDVDVNVQASTPQVARDPLLRDLVPGLRASASMNARVQRDLDGATTIRGRWIFRDVHYEGMHAVTILASGQVSADLYDAADLEDLASLRVALDVEGDHLRVGSYPLGRARGRVTGGPRRFGGGLTLEERDRSLSTAFDLRLPAGGGVVVDATNLAIAAPEVKLEGSARGVVVRGRVIEVGALALQGEGGGHAGIELEASARWDRRRGYDDALDAEVSGVSFETLRALLGPDDAAYVAGLSGMLSGSADLRGDLEAQPELHLDGTVANGRYEDIAFEGSLSGSYRNGRLLADAGVTLPTGGSADLTLRGTVDESLPLREALPGAAFEGELELHGLELRLLRGLNLPQLDDLPPIAGTVESLVAFSGALDIFDFEGIVEVPRLVVLEGDEAIHLGLTSRVGYQSGALVARIITQDQAGELVEGEVSVLLDLLSVIQDIRLLPLILDAAPWRVAARMSPRDLGTLEPSLRQYVPLAEDLRASLSLSVRGGAYRPLGDLIANVEYVGDLRGELCGQASNPRAEVVVELRDQRTTLEADAFVGDRHFAHAHAHADTPIAEWLRDVDDFEPPDTQGDAYLVRAPIDELPFACEYAAGPLSASVEFANLFSTTPSAELQVYSDGLRLRSLEARGRRGGELVVVERQHVPSSVLDLRASVREGTSLLGEGELAWWNGGSTHVSAEIPLRWGGVFDPHIDEEGTADGEGESPTTGAVGGQPRQFFAVATFDGTPLEAPLVWVPQVGYARGALDGEVSVRGPLADATFLGELALSAGQLEIPAVGQRLEDVEGRFLLEGDRVTLQGFSARDGEGIANVAGDLTLDGIDPERLEAHLNATVFPVRREGSVLAMLTGHTDVSAVFHDNGLEGALRIEELDIRLSSDLDRSPQDLSPHPDVFVIGQEREASVDTDPYEVLLSVRSQEPIGIKSDDFAATFETDLRVGYAGALSLEGDVRIAEGHFDVFGKRFEVERGAMVFDATTSLDPSVNLVAVHNLRSRPGETVTVSANGRLSDPQIRFGSSLTQDYAEIIALLVSGDVRRETDLEAERAPSDFLNGIVAGVLTLSLREELGAVVPNVIVESNRYGGARIRGGWRLEEILPETLRRVIQGVYVEGFLNTADEDGARTVGQVRDYGFLLELAFPRSVVNTNTVTPPNNFSLDVTWQP